MRYVIETECEVCGSHEAIEHQRRGGYFNCPSEWCDGSGGSRRVVTPTPMIRMGGLSPAWYVQDPDDTDVPDGWLVVIPDLD